MMAGSTSTPLVLAAGSGAAVAPLVSDPELPRPSRCVPVAFGRAGGERRIVGFYHAPLGGSARRAVVLCGPGGVEDLWAHASYRALAERLAQRGIATLRFDYDGQGDSAGDDRSPSRVAAWKESIGLAIDEVVARSGATSVGLFGLRLGASLAGIVAAERGGVDALALWAPVAGRVFLRELRAYRMLNPPASPPPDRRPAPGEEEAAGFVLTAETIAALAEVDLAKLTSRPAEHALLLPRDPTSNEERLAKKLAALGTAVVQEAVAGYGAMMLDPLKSVVPTAALEALAAWFVGLPYADPTPSPAARSTRGEATAARARIESGPLHREEVVRFGPSGELVGVVTEPIAPSERSRTALVLLNVGYNRRIGSNRMHVAIARAAAERGFSALRFDLRGLGDSESDAGPLHPYALDAVRDVTAALDMLERRGVRRVVLAGLCSGAFLAYHGALSDPRVRGVVLLNPQVFYFTDGDSLDIGKRTGFKSVRGYVDLIRSPDSWRRLARGDIQVRSIASMLVARLKHRLEIRVADTLARFSRGGLPRAVSVRRDFETLCKRGVRALLVFSAMDEGLDYVEAHLGAGASTMKGFPQFEMEILDGPDHTFAPVWSQEYVRDRIGEHLERHFG